MFEEIAYNLQSVNYSLNSAINYNEGFKPVQTLERKKHSYNFYNEEDIQILVNTDLL